MKREDETLSPSNVSGIYVFGSVDSSSLRFQMIELEAIVVGYLSSSQDVTID